MANQEEDIHLQNQQSWGTWEELLLASAVKRHGFKNWDSVALELQTKTCLPHLLTTAQICQQKYLDLNRRFNTTTTNNLHHNHTPEEDIQDEEQNNISTDIINNNIVSVPWLEELRKLRVAELKQEVKKLEEERERSVQEGDGNTEKPDLKPDRLRNEGEPGKPGSVSGEESDREDRSVNESNSTASGGGEEAVAKLEGVEPVQGGSGEPDPVVSGSNRKAMDEGGGGGSGGDESCEYGDSVTQLSSESLSSGRKRKGSERKEEVSVTGGEETVAVKSEPVVGFLEMIRAHRNGSLFESLLESQEMGVYKDMIRQHMDLEAIQTKLEQGSYSPSNLLFFRDLLLLFNNALVFFPKHSVESLTAHKIRSLVMDEMRKDTQKSDSTVVPENIPSQPKRELERSDSLLAKHKSTIPIIVCRKRSSISAKPSSSSLGQKIEQQQSNENNLVNDLKPPAVEQGLLKMKSEEKPVTGARSTRRGNKNLAKGSTSPSKKQNTSPDTKVAAPDKSETPKTEKKKNEALPLEKKKSAVDFLKRIKKNSPAETPKNNNRGASSGGERKMEGSGGKGERGKERVLKNSDKKQGKQESSPSKKNVGRPSKKAAEESRVSGKRGRDSGGKEVAKRPRKRSRRK
ncbi:PREDICTED: muscle M-line assembly protein unc-89-like isoform X3 [Populus euphratica]|uniref:Muscle M-line assembly protein unc-89-like isoform X3 n=1 Tax=Populus euphratica TaxID=75702 RepID=A0AAJ6T094_POPEU|nr:PREDICTED: muscle M-line assembly protein unc-89-like isoform X3 [Populus euphratica]